MLQTRSGAFTLAVLFLLATSLVGCASSTPAASRPANPPTTSAGTAAAPSQPAAQSYTGPLRKFIVAGYGSMRPTGSSSDLMIFLPEIKGWYKELGIDFEVVAMPVATVRIAALDAGQVHAMLDVSNPVFFRPKGIDLKVVFNDEESQTQYAVARPGLNVRDPKAWEGAKVRVSGLGENTIHVFMAKLIKDLGADPSKPQYTTAALPTGFKDATNALIVGTVDSTQLSNPIYGYARRQGVQDIGYLPDVLPYPGSGLAVSAKQLQDPQFRGTLKDVSRALVRGKRYLADPANRAEILALTREWIGNPPELSDADYANTLDERLRVVTPYGKLKDPQIYRGLIAAGFATGTLEPRNYPGDYATYDFQQMVDYTLLDQAIAEEGITAP